MATGMVSKKWSAWAPASFQTTEKMKPPWQLFTVSTPFEMCLAFYIACISFSSLYSLFMDAVLFMVLFHSFMCHVWFFMKHHRHPEALWKERVFPAWVSVLVGHSACSFNQYEWMANLSFKQFICLGVLRNSKQERQHEHKCKGWRERHSLLATNTHSSISLSEPSTFQTLIPNDTGSLLLGWLHVFTCSENVRAERVTDLRWPQMSFNFLM